MIKQKRLVLFSFFDAEGIVDDYVIHLVNELLTIATDIYFIVNGYINKADYDKLEKKVTRIMVRENVGFDGGAYKDVLVNYLGRKAIEYYDELILCNDTFFGPFVSFKEMWDRMELKACDFWGINYIESNLIPHMESYFMVFRRSIIQSNVVFDYFEKNILNDYQDIQALIADFEDGLTIHLLKNQYSYATYVPVNNINLYENSCTLLSNYGFPIIKKKAFCKKYNQDLQETGDAISYIESHYKYDIKIIKKTCLRLYDIGEGDYKNNSEYHVREYDFKTIVNINQLEDFVKKNNEIYIFGLGFWGIKLYHLFLKHSKKFKGFIVSKREQQDYCGYPVYNLNMIDETKNIIVGLSRKHTEEMREVLQKEHNCLFIW